ncbi:MAG: hypothetical protein R3B89_10130 [Polyangiaceae bacterium]
MRSPSTDAGQDLADPFRHGLTPASPPGVNARSRRRTVRAWVGLALTALLWSGCSSSDPTAEPKPQQACEVDTDCPAAMPFCNTGACLECRGSLDCAADQQCTEGACVAGPPCGAGCASGVCDPTTERCVECLSSDDCEAGEVCRDQHCVEHCESTADCGGIGVCDTLVGSCVACLGPSDCPSGQYCQAERCEPQVCTPSASQCEGNAVRHCNGTGSVWVDPIACGEKQTCVEEAGHAYCDVQRCTPGEVSCEQERVVKCSDDGLKLEVAEDCVANGQACDAAACVPVTCTPGETFCLGEEFRSCRLDGASSDPIQSCSSNQHCDDAGGCLLNVCTPGESTCVGNTLHVCDSDGSGYDGGTPCGSAAECVNGVCETHACSPDAYFCDGGNVQRCSVDGLTWNLADYCEPGGSCVDGETTCQPPPYQYCQPDAWYCYVNYRRKCNSAGTSYVQSEYCGAGEACVGTECVPVICTPGERFCKDGNVYACSADGSASILQDLCAPEEYCRNGDYSCYPDTCTPGSVSCSGNYLRTCNAEGSGSTSVSCAATGEICLQDHCETVVCTPLSKRCLDYEHTETCRADGSGWDAAPCDGDEHCSSGTCNLDNCEKGQVGCQGTKRATCKADGTGWEPGGVDCAASGQTCVAGECRDRLCEPSTIYCEYGDIYQCDYTGRAGFFVDTCSGSYHCEDGSYYCVENECDPGRPACDGTRATNCSPNGLFEAGGTVCGQYCAGGACVNEFFSEDFDTSLTGWSSVNADVQASLDGTTATESSAQSLLLTRTGSMSGTAISVEFPEERPQAISWWAMVDRTGSDASTIRFYSDQQTEPTVTHGFFAAAMGIRRNYGSMATSDNYLADRWYHFELRNIDWSTRWFDFYVDGVLRSQLRLEPVGYGVSRISLECGSAVASCRFDQIEFTP